MLQKSTQKIIFLALMVLIAFAGNVGGSVDSTEITEPSAPGQNNVSDKGPASDRLTFGEYSTEQAISALQAGTIDY